MGITAGVGIAVLALIAGAGVLIDRGVPNTLEAVAIRLMQAARRMRERRDMIEERQARMIAEEIA